MTVSGASAGGRRWHGRGRRWRRGDGGDRSGGDHSDRVGQKDEGIKARGRGERREAKEASGGQARTQRGGSEATVRRAHQVRIPATPMNTHTHTRPSPARHARPPRTLHQLGATPTASPPPSPHAQVETTSDSARTCRSKQRAIRRERADRVGAQIVWARGSGARMLGGHTGRARKCVFGCGSACGRRTARALQDGRCPGRSVSRTISAQDGRLWELLPR